MTIPYGSAGPKKEKALEKRFAEMAKLFPAVPGFAEEAARIYRKTREEPSLPPDSLDITTHSDEAPVFLPSRPLPRERRCAYCGLSSLQDGGSCAGCGAPR